MAPRLLLAALVATAAAFEEYREMGTAWSATPYGNRCAYQLPQKLPASILKRLRFFAYVSADEPTMLRHWLDWCAAARLTEAGSIDASNAARRGAALGSPTRVPWTRARRASRRQI